MIDQNLLADEIQKEVSRHLIRLTLAEVILEVASCFSTRKPTIKMVDKLRDTLKEALPGWQIERRGMDLQFYHFQRLPYEERVTITIRENMMGKFDYLDLMVKQLGPHLLGKKRAAELNDIRNRLPTLVRDYHMAEAELQRISGAFGPAQKLLFRRRSEDMGK